MIDLHVSKLTKINAQEESCSVNGRLVQLIKRFTSTGSNSLKTGNGGGDEDKENSLQSTVIKLWREGFGKFDVIGTSLFALTERYLLRRLFNQKDVVAIQTLIYLVSDFYYPAFLLLDKLLGIKKKIVKDWGISFW